MTYTGWLGLCPVRITDPFGDAPIVEARSRVLEPWLTLNLWVFEISGEWPLCIKKRVADPR